MMHVAMQSYAPCLRRNYAD